MSEFVWNMRFYSEQKTDVTETMLKHVICMEL